MLSDIALVLGAYLLGSVPQLILLARLRHVELDGDYHQTLWTKAGKHIAIIGVLGEFVKGVIPVLVGRSLDFSTGVIALAGLAAVCGQMWPVFSRFDGEKGNSVALPMVIALTPRAALVAIAPVIISIIIRTATRLLAKSKPAYERYVVGGAYSRSLPLGIFICFLLLPFTSIYFREELVITWCYAALFIVTMLRRLTAGLTVDLKASNEIRSILVNRLLYDRSTALWRQQALSILPIIFLQ